MNTQNQGKNGCKLDVKHYCEDHSVQLETELILHFKLPSVHPDFAAVSFLTGTAILVFANKIH